MKIEDGQMIGLERETEVESMRILLADGHPEVRSALRLLLENQTGMHVAGEVAEGTLLLHAVEESQPHVVLLDWELSEPPKPDLLPALRRVRAGLVIVALSGKPEAGRMALLAGAHAFVSKGDPPERLIDTLRAIASGLATGAATPSFEAPRGPEGQR